MFLEIIHAGRYDRKEHGSQITNGFFLSLSVSGLERHKLYSPDGTFIYGGTNRMLTLTPPGFRCEFSYSEARENFVIICSIPGLAYSNSAGTCRIKLRDGIMNVPLQMLCSSSATLRYKEVFQRIIKLLTAPTPANRFMAEELALVLIAELAVGGGSSASGAKTASSLAEKLKNRLDTDDNFALTLHRHCKEMGYTQAHLRRLFEKEYGITPGEYRMRRKEEKIMNLLASGSFTCKETAFAAGMKNVTHLHAFIKKRRLMTPGELQKKLRQFSS